LGLWAGVLGAAPEIKSMAAFPQASIGTQGTPGEVLANSYSAYSITPGSYQFLDLTGFGGRVAEYNSLQQSAGFDASTAYVSVPNKTTLVTRGELLTGDDYRFAAQLTVGKWFVGAFDFLSLVQQQDNYPFYAFPVLDIPPGSTEPLDTTTNLIPPNSTFGVTRRLGSAYARVKLPKIPVHLFVTGDMQARSGLTQFSYMDENATNTCNEQCHYTSQLARINYTTRNIGGGVDVDLGPVRLTYQHKYTNFNDRLTFPTGNYMAGFLPNGEGPLPTPPLGPDPNLNEFPVGDYYLNIPSPNGANSDQLNLVWMASPRLIFNGNVIYTRLTNTLTNNGQNTFGSDETLNWRPINRLLLTADYHQQNLINDFTPYYTLYGNVSYHSYTLGVRADYQLPAGFDADVYYRYGNITRSNSSLWPQFYSINNSDLYFVQPSSHSNTLGTALRYRHGETWSARAGYEWTGTRDPGYLTVPQSNNRIFADVTYTPVPWLSFTNDFSALVQNAFPAVPLPNNPGDFQRRNRLYTETASFTLRPLAGWDLGLGYSYQQNNLNTYMAFQNDATTGYVYDDPNVPYNQISQTYWAQTAYIVKQRLGISLRITYNSARSGMQPNVNPNDAAQLGNASLIQQGIFDPNGLFPSATNNLLFTSTPDFAGYRAAVDRPIQGVLPFSAQVRGRTRVLLRQLSGLLEPEPERRSSQLQRVRGTYLVKYAASDQQMQSLVAFLVQSQGKSIGDGWPQTSISVSKSNGLVN
jgi:hypothetical protein